MDLWWLIGWPASLSVVVLGFELGIHEGRQGSHVRLVSMLNPSTLLNIM